MVLNQLRLGGEPQLVQKEIRLLDCPSCQTCPATVFSNVACGPIILKPPQITSPLGMDTTVLGFM